MATTNNSTNNITNQELSIQINLSGLSFCVLNKNTNTITYLKHFNFEQRKTPVELLDALKHAFNTESALNTDSFNNVKLIYVNDLATLVPKSLFKEDHLADYLKFNSKILKTDFISFDDITQNDSVNVYVPYVNINNYIYDAFGDFTYQHFSTVLIKQILTIEKHSESTKLYVNVNTDSFQLVVVKDGQLLLYNTFEYTTKEDFIYYLLFTIEQLQLNPETVKLQFLGTITKDNSLYSIAYKYIRNISFGNRYDNYNYTEQPKTPYSNFTLIKSF